MKRSLVAVLLVAVAFAGFARQGAWVDEVVLTEEPNAGAAVLKLAAGDIDVYAFSIGDRALFTQVQANPDLKYYLSFGSFNDFTMNHSGDNPFFTDGRLNPFGVPAIREAMHWIIDREYIAQEIMGGLAKPKYSYINSAFPDAKRYPDVVEAIEDYYAYDFAKGEALIAAEMEKLGATKVDGTWTYAGKPVELKILIRTEDERRLIGDYISDQLEKVGFKVVRQYGISRELSPLWISSNPLDGLWSGYTGGWVTTAVSRDQGTGFNQFYTTRILPWPLFQALNTAVTDPVLNEVCDKLYRRDFNSMEERAVLFEQALWLSNAYANIIWLVDRTGFTPLRANVGLAADLAAGVYGSQAWGHTVQFQQEGQPVEGGTMKIATSTLLIEPWNPIAGSNWVYDMFPIRATGENAYMVDTRDGLLWPLHFERAEVEVLEGLPVGTNPGHDWLTFRFVDEIKVPADAWIDWDAEKQVFITVGEKYPDGLTAKRKSVVYYPASLYDVPLHDGSKISIGDFVLGMILSFDLGKPESAIYDEAQVSALESFLASFRGVKIVSENPLVIETYSDVYTLDAELAISTWFPYYDQGPGFWHALALGIMAEANKELTFSEDKSELLNVEWMDYTKGPSLPILAKYLDEALATGYIPYAPTMGKYVTAAEAKARYENLKAWYEKMGHFWVASGPFYLEKAYPTEKIIVLKRFEDYPYDLSKFQFLVQ
ncbi:ABC transporter substrate-binding protein [Candidatus Bipolaricaulota bacterium]|nr:ABC transporter substrate-binding protein [Candidatus Bipolaricaulota bacterium]